MTHQVRICTKSRLVTGTENDIQEYLNPPLERFQIIKTFSETLENMISGIL